MINIKSPHEIECMRKSGAILRDCLLFLGDRVKPGVSTKRLDEFAYDYIKRHDSTPSFLGYGGFPGTICASIDEVVVHGFPSDRRLKEGEIIGVDCGLVFKGWQADAARTFLVGEVSDEKKRLVDTTRESFFEGVKQFKAGGRLGDISHAVQVYNESRGYGVVRSMVGHGIGRDARRSCGAELRQSRTWTETRSGYGACNRTYGQYGHVANARGRLEMRHSRRQTFRSLRKHCCSDRKRS